VSKCSHIKDRLTPYKVRLDCTAHSIHRPTRLVSPPTVQPHLAAVAVTILRPLDPKVRRLAREFAE
jgi:hypothetical protein